MHISTIELAFHICSGLCLLLFQPADVRIQDQLECHVMVKADASVRTTLMGTAVRSAKRASTITPSVKVVSCVMP